MSSHLPIHTFNRRLDSNSLNYLYLVCLILFTILALMLNNRGFWIRPFWLDEVTTFHSIEVIINQGLMMVIPNELQPSLFYAIASLFQNEDYEVITLRIIPILLFMSIYIVLIYYASNKLGLFVTLIWAYFLTDNAYTNWIMTEYRPYTLSLLGHILVQSSFVNLLFRENARQRDILVFALGISIVAFSISLNIVSVCVYYLIFTVLLTKPNANLPETLFEKIKVWIHSKFAVLGLKWSIILIVILLLYTLFLFDVLNQGTELYGPTVRLSFSEAINSRLDIFWKSISKSEILSWITLFSIGLGIYFSKSQARFLLICLIVATFITYCFVVYMTYNRISWFSVRYLSSTLPIYWFAVAISCHQIFVHYLKRKYFSQFDFILSFAFSIFIVLLLFSDIPAFDDRTKIETLKHDSILELASTLRCEEGKNTIFIFPVVDSDTRIRQHYAVKILQFAYRKKSNIVVPWIDPRYSSAIDLAALIQSEMQNKSCIVLGANRAYKDNIDFTFNQYLKPIGYSLVKQFEPNKDFTYTPFHGVIYFSLYSL